MRIETKSPNRERGIRQYPITLMAWNKDLLDKKNIYPLLPRSLQLTLTKNPPIQKMRKTLMKSSYSYFSLADRARDKEKMSPMRRGPHKSHFLSYLMASSRSPGSMRRTYLIFMAIESSYFFYKHIRERYNGLEGGFFKMFLVVRFGHHNFEVPI